jgi:hypothetical protein
MAANNAKNAKKELRNVEAGFKPALLALFIFGPEAPSY